MSSSKKVSTKVKNSYVTITDLTKDKKYYVRVRTYKTVKVDEKNKKIYSSWSGISSFYNGKK